MQEELRNQQTQNAAKHEASARRMDDFEKVMTQLAEQGKSNTAELVNMRGQITAAFAQLNNLQSMWAQALQQQQQPQQHPQQQHPPTSMDLGGPHGMEEQSNYGKGNGKGVNDRVAAVNGLNHNLY